MPSTSCSGVEPSCMWPAQMRSFTLFQNAGRKYGRPMMWS